MDKIKNYEWEQLPNFTPEEFRCTCGCEQTIMDKDFIFPLQALRITLNRPLKITSGYRCKNHLIEKSKIAAGRSAGTHNMGKAADVAITGGFDTYTLIRAVIDNFSGIGINRRSSFVHLDTGSKKDGLNRPAFWNY